MQTNPTQSKPVTKHQAVQNLSEDAILSPDNKEASNSDPGGAPNGSPRLAAPGACGAGDALDVRAGWWLAVVCVWVMEMHVACSPDST